MSEYNLNNDIQHNDDAQPDYALQLSGGSTTSTEVQASGSQAERQPARGGNWITLLVVFMQQLAIGVLGYLHGLWARLVVTQQRGIGVRERLQTQWMRFTIAIVMTISFLAVCIALCAMGARLAVPDDNTAVAPENRQTVSRLQDLQYLLQLLATLL